MADHISPVITKRQQYIWLPNVKISELLDASVDRRAQSAYTGVRRLTHDSVSSATLPMSSKPYFQAAFQRSSPVRVPWAEYYKSIKKQSQGRAKIHSSDLTDIESRLSSLVLNHSDDEIFKRHFIHGDQNELKDSTEHLMKQSTVEESFLSASPAEDKTPKTFAPTHKRRSTGRSFEVVRLPTKSSKRHRFCLSNFPHTKRRQKSLKSKEIEEFQNEVTIDQKGLKQSWEYHVLAKLSGETQCFINHRFDGKEKPKEKLVDFLDAGYRDRDRTDYMTRKKKRLFDMPYKHEDFPDASTHL